MEITYQITTTVRYEASLDGFQKELPPEMRDYFQMLDLQAADCSVTDNGNLIESVFSIKGKNGEKTFKTNYVEMGFGEYDLDWYQTGDDGLEQALNDGELWREMKKIGFDEYEVDAFIEIITLLSTWIWQSVNKGVHLK